MNARLTHTHTHTREKWASGNMLQYRQPNHTNTIPTISTQQPQLRMYSRNKSLSETTTIAFSYNNKALQRRSFSSKPLADRPETETRLDFSPICERFPRASRPECRAPASKSHSESGFPASRRTVNFEHLLLLRVKVALSLIDQRF